MVLLSKSTQILFLFQLRCQITKIEVNNAPKYCGFYNYHGANKECNICFWTHRLNEAQSANISSNGWTTYAGIREGSQSDYWGDLVESRIRLISAEAEAEALLGLAELGNTEHNPWRQGGSPWCHVSCGIQQPLTFLTVVEVKSAVRVY